MEVESMVVVCLGSRSGQSKHVRVLGLTTDQEDNLYWAVEEVYGHQLMSDYVNTCELWVPDFSLEEVSAVIQAKLNEMHIPHKFQETISP